jgi:hypothetical protein
MFPKMLRVFWWWCGGCFPWPVAPFPHSGSHLSSSKGGCLTSQGNLMGRTRCLSDRGDGAWSRCPCFSHLPGHTQVIAQPHHLQVIPKLTPSHPLFETGSHVAQAGIELSEQSRLALNSCSSCFQQSRTGITGMCYHILTKNS